MAQPHSEEGAHRTAVTLNRYRADGLIFSALTKVYFVGDGSKKFALNLSSVKFDAFGLESQTFFTSRPTRPTFTHTLLFVFSYILINLCIHSSL
jgi:hypothetical protein